ncbi:DNA-binding transcriptional LysR family regulator [Novosphingobium sp. SG751A]|uniref:LysR family transcriptional regulator n=1 Tax=Novosphingobium sp. SG751A TaxID=2587000 RepID=UPI001551A0EE|nr:LysR family transcriptional regulator [Novosphingobium sp. SG751A]NOW46331.1 DNA-binding transcriptional LysR family regulator [Novosphingobium sp. SG751A]
MVHIVRSHESINAISPRQLVLFEATGRLGFITDAAAQCGLSQPAATQALQQLQEHTGLTLFERGNKGAVLSAAGKSFHRDVAGLLDHLAEALGIEEPIDLWRISARYMRALVCIHQRGSLDKAAATLGVTMRSIVRGVQALEERTAQPLLQGAAAQQKPTAQGAALAEKCARFLTELEWAIRKARDIQDNSEATFVVAVTADPGLAAIGTVAREHLGRHPNACLQVEEAAAPELLTRLVIGQVDLIFGYTDLPTPEGIVWDHLDAAEFRIAAALDHPLAARADAGPADLARYDWVDSSGDSQRHAALMALFAGRGLPRLRLITKAPPLIAQVIAGSTALGLMTDYELAQRRDRLIALPCSPPGLMMRIAVARRTDWQPDTAQADLLQRASHYFANRHAR